MSTETPTSKRDRQKARRAERLEAEAAARKKDNARRRVFTVLAIVVGAAIVIGIGYLLVQGTDRTLGVEPATIEGAAAPPLSGGVGPAEAAVGSPVPDVTGATVDGTPVSIGATGTPQAVVFMAHWCPNCQEEAPEIAEWVDQGLLADGVELTAVSVFHDPARPNWPPHEWLERESFPGQVMIDPDDSVATAWGAQGTPMWTFVDGDGTIVARHSGQINAEQFAEGSRLASGSGGA